MIHGSVHWASQTVTGVLQGGSGSADFSGVSTDTRVLRPGEIFFCLTGDRDGHEFASEAVKKGAAALVVDTKHRATADKLPKAVPVIQVKDTLVALGDLAHAWREKFSIPIIALTGSNGKTTTKELIRTVLSTHYQVHATEGNFNNLIGVPKTLFLLKKSDEIAVVEMGMNDFGEIARLTEITRPTVGLITNIGTAHLEKLRDLQGVARAKGELFAGLKPDAAALVNLSDAEIAKLPTPAQKKGYGTAASGIWGEIQKAPQGDPRPLHLKIHIKEETLALALQIPGSHNLSNVLAALAVGNHFNIPLPDVKRALENFTPAPSRMELKRLKDGKMLIDDCYNANPASTSAALKTLADMKNDGTSLAVLGDMLELGDFTTEGHLKVGREAAVQKTDYLIGIGTHAATLLDGAKSAGMASDRLYAFANADAAKKKVQELYKKVDWILVKGSRENHLENVVSYLKGSS